MDTLPQESILALTQSMKDAVQGATGLAIDVACETIPTSGGSLPMFVVTLPRDATPEQRAEADYCLNEIAPLFCYAE